MWSQFLISSAIIIFAGSRLAIYTDLFSDRIHIHKAWIGVVLLGLITSLPEAVTSLTAVGSLQAIDLAVGNILGSNCINPMLLVVLDIAHRRGPITNQLMASPSHVVSAIFAILLSMVVASEIFLGEQISGISTDSISLGNVLIVVIYFSAIHILGSFKDQPADLKSEKQFKSGEAMSFKKIMANLLLSSVFVIAAAIWLANTGDRLAEATGWGETFFGSIVLALVTSLPEIVVSLSALRIGSIHLAVGNIFGSNMMNIFIIFLCSLFYQGSIMVSASSAHIFTVLLSVILISIAIIGMSVNKKRNLGGVGWDSILMFVVFLVGTGIIYKIK